MSGQCGAWPHSLIDLDIVLGAAKAQQPAVTGQACLSHTCPGNDALLCMQCPPAGPQLAATHWHSLHSSQAKTVGSSAYVRPLRVFTRCVIVLSCRCHGRSSMQLHAKCQIGGPLDSASKQ